jgi:hypothetical protein
LQKQDNIMQRVAIVMALLAILSGTSANMGTAIVIAGTIHFFVCNPVIALLEAALLARWAKVPLQRAIALMIAANYLSFFVGLLLGGRISLTLGGISQMLWARRYLLPVATLPAGAPHPIIVRSDRSYRGDATLSWRNRGTGDGLSVIRQG